MMARRHAAAGVLAVLAAGCAPQGEWRHPSLPEAQWAEDRTACRSMARTEAEREFDLRQGASPRNYDPAGRWSQQMDRFSAQQREQRLFDDCMQVRGYTRAPQPESEAAPQTVPAPAAATSPPAPQPR